MTSIVWQLSFKQGNINFRRVTGHIGTSAECKDKVGYPGHEKKLMKATEIEEVTQLRFLDQQPWIDTSNVDHCHKNI